MSITRPRTTRKPPLEAFNRAELLVLLGSAVLLFAVSLPLLAVLPTREYRAVCANNLRMAGVAFHAWADDHGDNVPWLLYSPQGGSRGISVASTHWEKLFGYLPSSASLACPASPRKPTADFATLRDGNISYFIGSDADLTQPGTILSGDLDLEGGVEASCTYVNGGRGGSSGRVQSFGGQFNHPETYVVSWSRTNHYLQGNLLTVDGAVLCTDVLGLRRAFSRSTDEGNNNHALLPR